MEEVKRNESQLEDVSVELIHHIQSLFPVEEAARTCVLSKSWLQAWSIPTLRFYKPSRLLSENQDADYMKLIDRTLVRYFQDNIPMENFDLEQTIKNQKLASLANKWIRTAATQRCLNKLFLEICDVYNSSFILPDEIFSGENLDTIFVRANGSLMIDSVRNPVINCVSLKVLELIRVNLSDEVVDSVLSTCTLLEKINLSFCGGLTTIKVKNLRFLQKLKIISRDLHVIMQIDDVPSINSVINCVALKVLELFRVNISEEVLDNLFSACTLLEKIHLSCCYGFNTIKVRNLRYLQVLILLSASEEEYEILEVDDVPNLHYFWYESIKEYKRIPRTFNMDSLRSVTELGFNGVVIDVAFFDMIKSKLPFLENLNLKIGSWSLEKLDITSVSQVLELVENRQIDLQVYAPKLLNLVYSGTCAP